MEIPRLVISGTKSKVGKTMITVGLIRALINRGFKVQPYKVGPDFIDPGFHYFAAGRHSRNLDSFMLNKQALLESFCRNFKNADIAVIEGKTGLYDSSDAINEKGSVAEISKILKSPVILVVDSERLNRTIAAIVLGYKLFDPDVDLRGVILNKAGSERHRKRIKTAVEKLAKTRVFGIIPRTKISMPYRHLGLVTAYEREDLDKLLDELAGIIEKHVDVESLIKIAYNAPHIEFPEISEDEVLRKDVKIGVIRDEVFSFYYQDNIDELSKYADIIYLNSIKDKKLPDIDALYIGGGFPEVFAEQLEKNKKLREKIFEFCISGRPVYAECGGLMYLGKSIEIDGEEYEMVGILPLKTTMHKRFQAQGYCVYKAVKSCIIARKNQTLIGHEFHYSKPELLGKAEFAFAVKRGKGICDGKDGIMVENTLANYLHVHFLSDKSIVKRFINQTKKIKEKY